MTELILRNIKNIDHFYKMIDDCMGPVFIQTECASKTDIRRNMDIKRLLSEACRKGEVEKMSVVVSDNRDMPRIINYLIRGYSE